ncbi:UNVERIFIED_ORG: hypothetical protein E4P37_06900 [Bacillus sp. AZ43]
MSAQNQAVTRAIRRLVRPRLEAVGFDDFTGRKAWRREGDRVDVVDFQAVGGYSSVGVGCTPFSFGVYAGVRYDDCEEQWDRWTAGEPRPHYSTCTVVVVLGKRLQQTGSFRPWGDPGEDRVDTWAVRESASDVEEVVRDAADTLVATGLPVLADWGTPERAYTLLLSRFEPVAGPGVPGVHAGAPGSPRWTHTVRWLAGRLGRDAEQDIAEAAVLRGQVSRG